MSKKGVKMMFALLAIAGGMALTGCGKTEVSTNQPSTVYVDPTTENPTTETPTSEGTSTETPSTDNSDSTSTETPDITPQLLKYEDDIENALKDKLNARIGTEDVKSVDAKYFVPVADFGYGNSLQTEAVITFANNTTADATLGLPTTAEQFASFKQEGFESYNSSKSMADQYTIEQLESLYNFVSDENLTYSYAIKNAEIWDLDAISATKLEGEIEELFTQITQDYFTENYNKPYFQNVDLKTIVVEESSKYGKSLVLKGTVEYIKNGKVVDYVATLLPSESDYEVLKNLIENNGDAQKDLAENYTESQLATVLDICTKESTVVRNFNIESGDYTVNSVNNDYSF